LKAIDSMRRDWNERARHNAFLYIASWRHDWTEESFFASGEADVQRIVHPILEKLHLNSSVSSMAELGCGAGRMTRAFAKQFQSVTAIEISEEMQRKAQKYLADFSNVRWVLVDGVALAAIQGLNQKLEQKETEIAELTLRLEKLERLMELQTAGR